MKCPQCSHEWTPDKGELLSDLGSYGGKTTSRKKARAAKRNAKLGGWPKGKKRGPRKDANQVAHGVIAAAERSSFGTNASRRVMEEMRAKLQAQPPPALRALPSPKAPKRGR